MRIISVCRKTILSDSALPLAQRGIRIFSFCIRTTMKRTRRVWSTCLGTGSAGEMPFRVRNAAGEYRWFLTRAEPLRASDGTLLYWIGVNLEIDDAKQAENALRKSEKELREVVDTIPALIHTARPDGYIDYFNKRWLEYFGVTLDEVAGWN